jgi:hypothetical protein
VAVLASRLIGLFYGFGCGASLQNMDMPISEAIVEQAALNLCNETFTSSQVGCRDPLQSEPESSDRKLHSF